MTTTRASRAFARSAGIRTRNTDRWREVLGMTESEAKTLVAVITYWHIHKEPITYPIARDFMRGLGECRNPALTPLVRRGWIRAVGRVKVSRCSWAACYEPTARGYAILGLEQRKAA